MNLKLLLKIKREYLMNLTNWRHNSMIKRYFYWIGKKDIKNDKKKTNNWSVNKNTFNKN